ncbi:MAG: hypothetical protein JSW00_14210, partial [Thermoplasmata archaeon]
MMQKKALVGMILVLVALIMIGVSLTMPWYGWEVEYSSSEGSATLTHDYYLDHSELEGPFNVSAELNYDHEKIKDMHVTQAFVTTQVLTFVGIIGCIIGLIGALLVMVEKINYKIGVVLVLLAVILSLIAPIYLMVTLPEAFKQDSEEPPVEIPYSESVTITLGELPTENLGTDFSGSDTKTQQGLGTEVTVEFTWGGSTGWYLPIIAMILCIIALIFVATSKPAAEPVFQAQPIEQPGVVTFQPESPAPLEEPMAGPVFQPESPAGEMVFKAEPKAP